MKGVVTHKGVRYFVKIDKVIGDFAFITYGNGYSTPVLLKEITILEETL